MSTDEALCTRMVIDWEPGATAVSWENEGQLVRLDFADSPRSVSYISDCDGVVIVEALDGAGGSSNAILFDLDGTERLRLQPPPVSDPIGFDQVFQSRAGVIAVFATRQGDLQGRPNFSTGLLEDVREWR